jgi:hypothetical protein
MDLIILFNASGSLISAAMRLQKSSSIYFLSILSGVAVNPNKTFG